MDWTHISRTEKKLQEWKRETLFREDFIHERNYRRLQHFVLDSTIISLMCSRKECIFLPLVLVLSILLPKAQVVSGPNSFSSKKQVTHKEERRTTKDNNNDRESYFHGKNEGQTLKRLFQRSSVHHDHDTVVTATTIPVLKILHSILSNKFLFTTSLILLSFFPILCRKQQTDTTSH
jgi:hypothetical protein